MSERATLATLIPTVRSLIQFDLIRFEEGVTQKNDQRNQQGIDERSDYCFCLL